MSTSEDHEEGLALFISREWRQRFRESLSSPKRRGKLTWSLAHFRHLDHRFTTAVPTHDQKSFLVIYHLSNVVRYRTERGARTHGCALGYS
jgi:hypothetical protein